MPRSLEYCIGSCALTHGWGEMFTIIVLVMLFSAVGYLIVAPRLRDWIHRKQYGHGIGLMMKPPPATHDWSKPFSDDEKR